MNATVITFLIVIFGSICAGIGTGAIAHYLGNESLEGVSTPEENPSQKLTNGQESVSNKEFTLINEKDILVKVYDLKHAHKQKQQNK